MKLSDISVRNYKPKDKQFKVSDGGGMYLLIHPNGSKYWRLKYKIFGKEKLLSIGTYPQISLKEARNKRDEAKKQIAEGLDPSQEKKLKKIQQQNQQENNFEYIARKWHQQQASIWTPRHADYVLRRLEVDIFPKIGFSSMTLEEVSDKHMSHLEKLDQVRKARIDKNDEGVGF